VLRGPAGDGRSSACWLVVMTNTNDEAAATPCREHGSTNEQGSNPWPGVAPPKVQGQEIVEAEDLSEYLNEYEYRAPIQGRLLAKSLWHAAGEAHSAATDDLAESLVVRPGKGPRVHDSATASVESLALDHGFHRAGDINPGLLVHPMHSGRPSEATATAAATAAAAWEQWRESEEMSAVKPSVSKMIELVDALTYEGSQNLLSEWEVSERFDRVEAPEIKGRLAYFANRVLRRVAAENGVTLDDFLESSLQEQASSPSSGSQDISSALATERPNPRDTVDHADDRELHYLLPAFGGRVVWTEGYGDPVEYAAGAASEDASAVDVQPVVRFDEDFEAWERLVVSTGENPGSFGIDAVTDAVESDTKLKRYLRSSFSRGLRATPTRTPTTQIQREALAGALERLILDALRAADETGLDAPSVLETARHSFEQRRLLFTETGTRFGTADNQKIAVRFQARMREIGHVVAIREPRAAKQ
jgi:hypothetical protein